MADPKFDDTEPLAFEETEALDVPSFDDTEEVIEDKPPKTTEAFLGGAFQDITMGAMDEIKGALEAAGQAVGVKGLGQEFGKQELQTPLGLDQEKLLEAYYQGRDLERQRIEELKDTNSGAFTAGEVTGMVVPAIASGGASLTKNMLTSGAKALVKEGVKETAKKGTQKLLSKEGAKLFATGAAMGGAGAAGYSETEALEQPEELLKEIGTGAAIGGGMSLVIPGAVKGTKDLAKYTANKIRQGGKYVLEAGLGLDKGGIDYAIKNFDKIQDVVDYPEIRTKLLDISKNASKMVSNLSKTARKMLDTEQGRKKTIPKRVLIEKLETQMSKLDPSQESAAKSIQNVIDNIKGQKLREAPLNDALEKINERINKEINKAQKLGYQTNFQSPEWDLKKGIVSIMGTVDGEPQVIPQKIKPITKNISKYDGDLLSLKDLHEIVTDTGKMLKGRGADFDNVVPALKQTYGELSETLKELVPDKNFKRLMGEIHEGINKVNSFDKYFKLEHKIPRGAVEKITPTVKQIQKFDRDIGLDTKDLDPERYLKDIEEYVGKSSGNSIEDVVKQRRFKGLIEGGKDYTATGGSDIKSKVRGLSAKPLLKKGLKFASEQNKKKTAEKVSKFTDTVATTSAIPAVAGAVKTGAKVATNDNLLSTKLDDYQTLEELIGEFEASDKPGVQGYAEQLKQYGEADTEQEKRQIRFNLQGQPAFRKLLQEYDELKKK